MIKFVFCSMDAIVLYCIRDVFQTRQKFILRRQERSVQKLHRQGLQQQKDIEKICWQGKPRLAFFHNQRFDGLFRRLQRMDIPDQVSVSQSEKALYSFIFTV